MQVQLSEIGLVKSTYVAVEEVLHVHFVLSSKTAAGPQTIPLPARAAGQWSRLESAACSTISQVVERNLGQVAFEGENFEEHLEVYSTPRSPLNSPGSRCLTTDLADPESFCHIFGAASFFSLSFSAASNHWQLVTKLSKDLGSPSQVGTSDASAGIKMMPSKVPGPPLTMQVATQQRSKRAFLTTGKLGVNSYPAGNARAFSVPLVSSSPWAVERTMHRAHVQTGYPCRYIHWGEHDASWAQIGPKLGLFGGKVQPGLKTAR